MMPSRTYLHKHDKTPGLVSEVDYIPKNKIHLFKRLFNQIKEEIGSYDKARDYVGLSAGSLDKLEKGKLSTVQAKKILDAHRKLNNKG